MANAFILDFIESITRERRGITREFVVETLECLLTDILAKTWHAPDTEETRRWRDSKCKTEHPSVRVRLNPQTGDLEIRVKKTVVERVTNPHFEVSVLEARRILGQEPVIGESFWEEVPMEQIPRSAIKRLQHRFKDTIVDEERRQIVKEFKLQVKSIRRGKVQKVDKHGLFVSMDKVEGFLPNREMIPGERYRPGDILRVMVLRVEEERRNQPQIILTRTHPDFLRGLLELDIPEVAEGKVEIKAVARRPGQRAKVAVWSSDPRLDPVGIVVGHRGTRLLPIQRELQGERIDVVRWSPDLVEFAALALSPTDPLIAYMTTDEEGREYILVGVRDEEISEAKGKEGINVILASDLVGRRIEVMEFSKVPPPPRGVSIYDLDLPEPILRIFRTARKYVFTEVPSLAEMHRLGLDEDSAMRILDEIERKLKERVSHA